MIGFITGSVVHQGLKSFLILTSGGVGYEIFAPLPLLGRIEMGKKIEVWIYTRVTENEITLYGFEDLTQKQFFEKLLGISGIGPKTAIGIVSTPVEAFMKAVAEGDEAFISRTPGIGKKMAQKIIVELQGKIDLHKVVSENIPSFSEAISALEGLGYDQKTVVESLKKAPEGLSSEELVKYFLRSRV